MAYDPPSQRPEDTTPESTGETRGAGETVPMSSPDAGAPGSAGGYTPPPSGSTFGTSGTGETGGAGGYTPPPGGAGGYTPPPSGGYTPPQGEAGRYTPPPGTSGESMSAPSSMPSGEYTPPQYTAPQYTPPEQGGYTPPPQQGGPYGAPPPPGGEYPVPPPLPMATTAQAGALDIGNLFQSYINAVTKPNVSTFAEEIPRANNNKTLIGVAIVAAVNLVTGLLGASMSNTFMGPFRDQLTQQGIDPDTIAGAGVGVGVGSAIIGAVLTFFFFYAGSWVLLTVARMLGGQGADFMTHSYLLSLSYVPIGVASSVLGLVPLIGILGIVLFIYRQYLQGLSMQASQNMDAGRAQLAAFLPFVLFILLICLGVFLCAGFFAAALQNANP
jgi:Yip1 domain